MNDRASPRPQLERHLSRGQECCDPEWEAAYKRFETAEQEVAKFVQRLRKLGLSERPKSIQCIELFCGRGGGLVALERLGFQHLTGVDLSESLLQEYQGKAGLHLADCRQLPLDSNRFDAVVVQGGLHHLPVLPDDLELVLDEIRRILRRDGEVYLVEPWLTPFLRFAHRVVENRLVRRFYARGDALATMIEHERETYEQWLGQPQVILTELRRRFRTKQLVTKWGKLCYVGHPRHSQERN